MKMSCRARSARPLSISLHRISRARKLCQLGTARAAFATGLDLENTATSPLRNSPLFWLDESSPQQRLRANVLSGLILCEIARLSPPKLAALSSESFRRSRKILPSESPRHRPATFAQSRASIDACRFGASSSSEAKKCLMSIRRRR